MGKCKRKIAQLDRNKKYKLQKVLDIISTSDYSNTLSSSDDNFENDNTFNTNSMDSENSSEGNEVIPPSPKQTKINGKKQHQRFTRHATGNNPKNVEYGTHQTLDTTSTQNSPPSSTAQTENSQNTTLQLHHDHDHVPISTTATRSEYIFTNIGTALRPHNQPSTENQQHRKLLRVEPYVEKPLPISTSTPLQLEGVQDQEHQEDIITIQLETPECNILGVNPPPKNESTIELQTPEADILTVNPTPENECILPVLLESPATDILTANLTPENDSEHTGSTELISDFEFPPDYFQNLTTDDTNSSDENAIDDYYEIENALVNPNL